MVWGGRTLTPRDRARRAETSSGRQGRQWRGRSTRPWLAKARQGFCGAGRCHGNAACDCNLLMFVSRLQHPCIPTRTTPGQSPCHFCRDTNPADHQPSPVLSGGARTRLRFILDFASRLRAGLFSSQSTQQSAKHTECSGWSADTQQWRRPRGRPPGAPAFAPAYEIAQQPHDSEYHETRR
jgi:hypothetical protein